MTTILPQLRARSRRAEEDTEVRRSHGVRSRLAVLVLVGTLALLGMPLGMPAEAIAFLGDPPTSESEPPGVDANQEAPATSEPASPEAGEEPAPTTTSEQAPPGEGEEPVPTTTSEQAPPGESEEPVPAATSEPAPPDEGEDPMPTTTVTADVSGGPVRPSASPRVSDSQIPAGSVALALLVLASVGGGSYLLVRRAPGSSESDQVPPMLTGQAPPPADAVGDRPARDRAPIDPATPEFLIGLGEALMDAGASVGHVESALRTVARSLGAPQVGVIVLPTALIVSVPNENDLVTEIGTPGRDQLRLDQVDDVLRLVRDAESASVGVREGRRRLAEIRSARSPYPPRLALVGHALVASGVAAILHGTWVEIVFAALFGAAVGALHLRTRSVNSSAQPFVVLIAATAVSASVFALTRIVDDLLTFPLLIAPLVTLLPGGLLTIAVLELVTGQIVSGASRLASGGLQLVLLALGIVAGSQLVGVPARELGSTEEAATLLTPWIGVAVFGIGVVWFYGARASARVWIVLVMYVAYAGQVIGGLFFGSALSAFFGALAMTPIAVLIARRPDAPKPLVTILTGFWLLVPGALGLDGVTRLFGAGGAAATGALVTTVTSMVGVSLGILLGLLLVASDPARPWSETPVAEPTRNSPEPLAPGQPPTS